MPLFNDPNHAAKGGVKHVHSAGEFEKELANAGSRLVIVDFFATWVFISAIHYVLINVIPQCGPCKMIAPVLEDMSREHTGAIFLKVDVDQLQASH